VGRHFRFSAVAGHTGTGKRLWHICVCIELTIWYIEGQAMTI
jgi:hypothetical protein